MVSSRFAPVVGQSQAIELLTQAIDQQRIAPAYLFMGPVGVGRSLVAECFLGELLGRDPTGIARAQQRIQQRNHPDLLWVEPTYLHQGKMLSVTEAQAQGVKRKAPPQIRLEQIRDIVRFLSRPALEAQRSVVVLDQAETMAEAAANGLLKTLEEPGNATLILMAPSGDALLPTLVSRCQSIPFSRLSSADLAQVLTQTGHDEILAQPEVLAIAQGSPGMAIVSWQQLQTIPSDLLAELTTLPQDLQQALSLAQRIAKALELESQLWLLDYLQQSYWRHHWAHPSQAASPLQQLEQARFQLLKYVQPRLVWEVTLMALMGQA